MHILKNSREKQRLNKYKLQLTKQFDREVQRLIKKNTRLESIIIKTIGRLKIAPFYSGLSTHKVHNQKFGEVYTSRVTGDLRILWKFNDKGQIIILLTIGGHSGKRSVYR